MENESEVMEASEGIKKIAVVGAGTIGTSWATLFAAKGYKVNLHDIKKEYLEQAFQTVEKNLKLLKENGLVNENITSTLNRIFLTTDLSLAVKDADYVQESVCERFEVKKVLFAQMDSICSEDVILASSSSGLLMSDIQKFTRNPERCIIAHPFNPPHLIPLVELVPGKKTSKNTMEVAYRFYLRVGRIPLKVKKEVPGYIANRLCAALWREAIDLVCRDVASVRDVDLAICAGPGLRWVLMGPHLIYHLGGGKGGIEEFVKHLGPAFETWWSSMSSWTSIPPLAVKKIVEGIKEEIGENSLDELYKWRDEKLLSILKTISGA
ncbi:3-hydroxyacyl-CoA dehydrogenase family protein [Candidatus Aerophobetes bacterium]|nr:3-hydroxyacyl-CoA dehydrogenase family protein [Candidatus Aerophobetes bacterium]